MRAATRPIAAHPDRSRFAILPALLGVSMPPSAESSLALTPASLVRRRRGRRVPWFTLALLLAVGSVAAAWGMGYSPRRLWGMAQQWRNHSTLPTLLVDEGDLPIFIVESGALESANNTPVKCQVKAILGSVNSALGGVPGQGGAGGRGGQGQNRGGAAGGGAAAGASGAGAAGGAAAKTAGTTKGAAGTTKGAAGATGTAANKGATGTTGAGGAAGGATSAAMQAPIIRSFTYIVAPYVPLRGPATAQRTSTIAAAAMTGGPGGGGGGGRGGGGMMQERSGSTRILTILPEGTAVKAGDVVCELDSAAFRDELMAQQIKWEQAKSWVEQAQKMHDVNEISLREYEEGILPQDRLLIEQYIEACKSQLQKARNDLEWGRKAFEKGLRSAAQLKVDGFNFQRAEIALSEANRMLGRLQNYTAPRLVTNLEAKLASIKSDLLAQQSAFELEDQRRRDLQKMIENCTLRAPIDGVVVYANTSNAWGRAEDQIREGIAVREGQPIFNIPDATRMRVKAKINESKVSMIHAGQPVEIRVDAFPDRPFRGTVEQVTPIPAPAAGPISDVKIYYATVDIEEAGFGDLRPGMSAEVNFLQEARRKVTRVPVQAIRRVGSATYVALPSGQSFRWQPVELGAVSPSHAEVRDGLKPGDRVVATPDSLPPPPAPAIQTAAN